MSFTVCDITTMKKIVLAVLNASSAYASTSDDDKFTDGEIAEFIFEGDERFYTAIAETKGHWARPEIMSEATAITTQGAEVPVHFGELGEVTIKYVNGDSDYKPANPLSRKEIEIYQRDTDSYLNATHAASGTLTAGYYDPEALMDGICYFTGYAMQIRVVGSYARTAALQSPSSYTSGLLAHALSVGFSKDGLDPNLALYYSKEADKREMAVRGNARALAELQQRAAA